MDRMMHGLLPVARAAMSAGSHLEVSELIRTGAGHHYYFRATGRLRLILNEPFVELLSEGRFAVAPPSLHASGNRYRTHRLSRTQLPQSISEPPDWLAALLTRVGSPEAPDWTDYAEDAPRLGQSARDRRYAERAFESGCARVATTPEGARNNTLNDEAYSLARFVWSDDIPVERYSAGLTEAGLACGLKQSAVERTIRSAFSGWLRNNGHSR
jgi:hypothetical protein